MTFLQVRGTFRQIPSLAEIARIGPYYYY